MNYARENKQHPRNLIIKAKNHIIAHDDVLKRIIEVRGFHSIPILRATYFVGLARSIVFQQLSPQAASRIWDKLRFSLTSNGRLTPRHIISTPPHRLRRFGLSSSKSIFMHELSNAWVSGKIKPHCWRQKSNDKIREQLISIKGIGPWTADMFLIFSIGRKDVIPLNDYGLQRAIRLVYKMKNMPNNRQILALSRKWHPFESFACWQLWKYLDSNDK